jgi:putative transposase
MAKENPGWGYDRIVGAMANLGLRLSDQTVGNNLRRHDIPPAPKRKQTIAIDCQDCHAFILQSCAS